MTDQRLYKHIKSGNYYYVLNSSVLQESNLETLVIYTRVNRSNDPNSEQNIIWARPLKEFEEKFKAVKLKE